MTETVEKGIIVTPGGRVGDDSSLDRSPKKNWIERAGGLPKYIRTVANALVRSGKPRSMAIPMAIGIVRNWAQGKSNVSAKVRAAAVAAMAEWEAKKAKSGKIAKSEPVDFDTYMETLDQLRTDGVLTKAEPRDGDGDGFVHDGTPRQRPAILEAARRAGALLNAEDKARKAPPAHMQKATPELLQQYKEKWGKSIPPSWTDVWIDLEGKHGSIARGIDAGGKFQNQHTKEYEDAQAADKYERLNRVFGAVGKIDAGLEDVGDDPTRAAMRLMHLTGMRVASTDKQTGKVKAFGATTLRTSHVTKTDTGYRLDFIAKEGIPATYDIDDPELVRYITARLETGDEGGDFLFPGANARKTQAEFRKISGIADMKNHDIRTLMANRIALQHVATLEQAKNDLEFSKLKKQIAKSVSDRLRNKPEQALSAYINPAVFTSLIPAKEDAA